MMDEVLTRALAAAARAFADELERDLSPRPSPAGVLTGSSAAMFQVLRSIGRINDELGRGASDEEVRAIAQRAGIDPRGLAGYHSARLLDKRDDGRWLSPDGRDRLDRLTALSTVVLLGAEDSSHDDSKDRQPGHGSEHGQPGKPRRGGHR
jgi:hypothetical protein